MSNAFILNRRINTLMLGTAIALTGVVGLQAQDATEEDSTFEEIVVTGSHIRRTGYEKRTPIQVLNRADIVDQGAATILDVVKFLPANTGSFITQETGDLIGTSQFNIRGLGAGSTLTLINGRRSGKSATSDGNGNQFFDINQLPLSMIERIDVQTDGASVTYGSDAVGGVVNIITRKGFEGLELSAKASTASNDQWNISLATGAKGDRGSVNLYATYYKQTRNDRSDFKWLRERIGDLNPDGSATTSSTGAPGTYELAILNPDGSFLDDSGPLYPDPDCEAAGGILSGGRCRLSFMDQVSVIPEESRIQAFVEADYELSDSLKFYTEISFSHNEVNRTSGPNLFRNGEADGSMLIPGDHPFNFWIENGTGGLEYIGADAWDNDIHTGAPIQCNCRPLGFEFMGRGSEFDREFRFNYIRALGGLKYDINDTWYADVSYVYNKAERSDRSAYEYVASAFNASLANGTYNPFGTRVTNPTLISPKDGISVAGLNYDDFDTWNHRPRTDVSATQAVIDAVIGGDLFDMAGGPVGVAIGGQYRKETFFQINDSLSASGNGSTPDTGPLMLEGETTVYALFAEALLPVTDDLEISIAGRYEDFGGGITTTDPKISARWEMTDAFSVRASYGTSFQLPSATQKARSSSTQFLDDPVSIDINGVAVCVDTGLASNTTINVTGSDDLKPQSSKNINAGVVYNKAGFMASLDYWRFDYTGLIGPDGVGQAIVDNDCSGDGIPNDPRIIRDPGGQLRTVNLSFVNAGSVVTDGLDFQTGYTFPAGEMGQIDIKGALSYVNKFEVEGADGEIVDGAGTRNFANQFASVPRWRGNVRSSWMYKDHTVSVVGRYISSYENDQGTDSPEIAAWTSVDLRYSYQLGGMFGAENTMIAIGANNVFDKLPPELAYRQRPGYDASVHEIRGRLLYAEFTVSF